MGWRSLCWLQEESIMGWVIVILVLITIWLAYKTYTVYKKEKQSKSKFEETLDLTETEGEELMGDDQNEKEVDHEDKEK